MSKVVETLKKGIEGALISLLITGYLLAILITTFGGFLYIAEKITLINQTVTAIIAIMYAGLSIGFWLGVSGALD